MSLPVSLILIAIGAVLVWGVTYDVEGVDLDAVGVILIVTGLVGFVLSLILWDRWSWSATRRRRVYDAPRTSVVEEEIDEERPPL